MNTNLLKAKKTLEEAKLSWKNKVIKEILACKHTRVYEGSYMSGLFVTLPPYRVCDSCGYKEEGWHCGYTLLENAKNREVIEVQRDFADRIGTTTGLIPNEVHFKMKLKDERHMSLSQILEERL